MKQIIQGSIWAACVAGGLVAGVAYIAEITYLEAVANIAIASVAACCVVIICGLAVSKR